jgi:hypothetical protein
MFEASKKAIKRIQVKQFLKRWARLSGEYDEYNHNNLKHSKANFAAGGFQEYEEFEKKLNNCDAFALSDKAYKLHEDLYNKRSASGKPMLGSRGKVKPFMQVTRRLPFGTVNKNLRI